MLSRDLLCLRCPEICSARVALEYALFSLPRNMLCLRCPGTCFVGVARGSASVLRDFLGALLTRVLDFLGFVGRN